MQFYSDLSVLAVVVVIGIIIAGGINVSSVESQMTGANNYIAVTAAPFQSHNSLQLSTFRLVSAPTDCTKSLKVISAEPTILYAFDPPPGRSVGPGGRLKVWYMDELPITIGISGNGSQAFNSNSTGMPDHASPAPVGDITAKDCSGNGKNACTGQTVPLPAFPALFLVDTTVNANATPQDAIATSPHPVNEIFGEWKRFGTNNPLKNPRRSASSILFIGPPAEDPFPLTPTYPDMKVISGSRVKTPGSENTYGAELIWNVDSLGLTANIPPHNYLAVFVLHDGDNNNGIADIGIGCTTITY